MPSALVVLMPDRASLVILYRSLFASNRSFPASFSLLLTK